MRHIIGILLLNESGALSRVAGLFSSRGYNIESLSVSATQDTTVSRVTLVTKGSEAVIQQIVAQLNKLIDVVSVDDMTTDDHLERELVLIKIRLPKGQQPALAKRVTAAGGRILHDEAEHSIVELTANEAQITRFVEELSHLGEMLEVVRSGALAIARRAADLQLNAPVANETLTG